jgi:hypothetical protein
MINKMVEKFSDSEEKTIEDFVEKLKTDGRYFVGNPYRVNYIGKHKAELEQYISTLGKSEADLVRGLIKINSKPGLKRQMNLTDRLDARSLQISNPQKEKASKITGYDSRPRKKVERLIFPIVTLLAIGGAFYIGEKCKVSIEKMISTYTAPIFKLYDDINHGR